jgi:competence ComEA-like helix-hairpin-helix protein
MNRSFLFFLAVLFITGIIGVVEGEDAIEYYSDDILCRYKIPVSCGIKKTLLCVSDDQDYASQEIIKGCGCDIKDIQPVYGSRVYIHSGCVIEEFKMSGYEILLLGMKIDLNSATLEDLVSIDGIGESIADKILNYRLSVQRFERIEVLLHIKGIGRKTLNKLSKYVCVDCDNFN